MNVSSPNPGGNGMFPEIRIKRDIEEELDSLGRLDIYDKEKQKWSAVCSYNFPKSAVALVCKRLCLG